MNGVAVEFTIRRCAEVIFHVTRTLNGIRFVAAALEFMENRAVRFAHEVRENRQAPTVWHTYYDFLNAKLATAFNDLFKRWDQAFAAVQTEPLGAHVFDMEVFLKTLGFDQFVKNCFTARLGEGDFFAVALNTLLKPTSFFCV